MLLLLITINFVPCDLLSLLLFVGSTNFTNKLSNMYRLRLHFYINYWVIDMQHDSQVICSLISDTFIMLPELHVVC